MEISALFALGNVTTPPADVVDTPAPVTLETVADVVLQLTPLTSLLIVLLEPKIIKHG